jgi:serine/threonine protein phosphatase PrpC
MRTINALIAAGQTDPGRHRNVNEDRFHCDAARGHFIVIDGVGGQAAGGRAADVALSVLRTRLERETGTPAERIREAITAANNEIFRLAGSRPEWNGMACVLTVALIDHGKATIGHVGDTRLYKLRNDRIEKITRDHSPVGEREDSRELSELQAMRHPRRNEVYRDVGSEPHEPDDVEFVDIHEIPIEADAALLLCSDGLSDLVDSGTIADVVNQCVGEPEAVTRALIEMANAAGGKDNITVVYIEGEKFAASQVRRLSARVVPPVSREKSPAAEPTGAAHNAVIATVLLVIGFGLGIAAMRLPSMTTPRPVSPANVRVVQPSESIAAAIATAEPGAQIIVEPGEYRERLVLKDGVRLVSRVPRGATIRLPSSASDADPGPAVVASDLSNAELIGFRIIGDAATPLAVGIGLTGGALSVVNVEISGATKAGIEFGEGSSASVLASEIHDNPGAAIFVRSGANPRIANNVFTRNGMSERASGSLVIHQGSTPQFERNVFIGLSPDAFVTLDEAARLSLKRLNWFLKPEPRSGDSLPVPGFSRGDSNTTRTKAP